MKHSLRINRLHCGYGKHRVIRGLSTQEFAAGTMSAVLGPNGSGKSSLLRALAGMLAGTQGEVLLDGADMLRMPPQERAARLAYMPQNPTAPIRLRVFDAVLAAICAQQNQLGASLTQRRHCMASLQRLGLEQLALRHLDELSGGQRQLVGLALALAREPRLLLLDEPLAALDLRHQSEAMQLLARETAARGLITLIVLHDLDVALRYCQQAIVLQDGGLVAQGKPEDIITPQLLAQVYGVRARLEYCSQAHAHVFVDGGYNQPLYNENAP